MPMVSRAGRLADALRRARAREEARLAAASVRREASLAGLADELAAMADDLPPGEADRFALVRSTTGDRLVIDALSHVDVAPDGRSYRLVRQRREGPETLLETDDQEAMAVRLADYIAERIVEREILLREPVTKPSVQRRARPVAPEVHKGLSGWAGFWLFVLGALCAGLALFTFAWLSYPPAG